MLFVIAGVLFVVGLGMILIGDQLRRRGQPADLALPEGFWKWFLGVVKRSFSILTGQGSAGEKVAAAGTILLAASVIAFVAGIIAALGSNGDDGSSTTSSTTSTTRYDALP